jgi:hypothetical protein
MQPETCAFVVEMSSEKDKRTFMTFRLPLKIFWHAFCSMFFETGGKKPYVSSGEADEKIIVGFARFGLYVVCDTDRQNRVELLAKPDL